MGQLCCKKVGTPPFFFTKKKLRYFVAWGVFSNLIRTTEWSSRLKLPWNWGVHGQWGNFYGLTSQWSFQSCKLAYWERHLTCHVQWKRHKRYHWGADSTLGLLIHHTPFVGIWNRRRSAQSHVCRLFSWILCWGLRLFLRVCPRPPFLIHDCNCTLWPDLSGLLMFGSAPCFIIHMHSFYHTYANGLHM